jgi:hypothetical protein
MAASSSYASTHAKKKFQIFFVGNDQGCEVDCHDKFIGVVHDADRFRDQCFTTKNAVMPKRAFVGLSLMIERIIQVENEINQEPQEKKITNDQPGGYKSPELFLDDPGKNITKDGNRQDDHPHCITDIDHGGHDRGIRQPVFQEEGKRHQKKQAANKGQPG